MNDSTQTDADFHQNFPATRWSLILHAQVGGSVEQRRALEAIEAGWSGGSEKVRIPWDDTNFTPPSPEGLGSAVWPLIFGQNSETNQSGTHFIHRFTAEASRP
ncbi:MAG: hypothetical protein ACI9R3_000617 [Verrucomicrobiales bacterium]|jgi:hypothetical protein